MKTALTTVYWEILRKNQLVFPSLGVLLVLGAALAWAASQAAPGADWPTHASRIVVVSFLISLVIGYAPFTMMESSGGWRMNSMVTRWFALPLSTGQMVLWPLLTACVFVGTLVALWIPVLNRIAPGLDGPYFIAVLITGQVAITALAWTFPRKPIQFWVGAGMVFPIVLIFALMFQDQPGMENVRRRLYLPLGFISLLLAVFSWLAASRNRCGAWPGELPLDRIWDLIGGRGSAAEGHVYRSPGVALWKTETMPTLRLLAISWFGLIVFLFLFFSLRMRDGQHQFAFSLRLIPMMAMGVLPIFGILWMAGWSMFAAGEPVALFRSRFSTFRAALPVTCGLLAGQRILMLLAGWCIVWAPLVIASFWYTPSVLGIPVEELANIQLMLARIMSLAAFVVVGALPILLWGRFEGFPNFLLACVCAWAFAWALASSLSLGPEEEPGGRWLILAGLLGAKLMAAIIAVVIGLKRRHVTWRFPLALFGGWLAVTALLLFGLPIWKGAGPWVTGCVVLMTPLARLAWSPLAIASNRHRS